MNINQYFRDGLLHFWELDEFKAIDSVNGILVYNLNDLKKIIIPHYQSNNLTYNTIRLAGPDNPTIITGLDYINCGNDFYFSKTGSFTFFHCHGNDRYLEEYDSNQWATRPNANPQFKKKSIPDLVRMSNLKYYIDFVHSCNEGNYELDIPGIAFQKGFMDQDIKIHKGKYSVNYALAPNDLKQNNLAKKIIKITNDNYPEILELLRHKKKSSSKIKNILKK